MKFQKLIFPLLLTLSLVVFWIAPQKVFAADTEYQMLSTWEAKKMIEKYPKQIFNYWIDKKTSGKGNSLELTTLSLLKEMIRLDVWDYALSELPLDVSFNVIKQSFELSKIILSGDVSGIIQKIEGESVKIAVKYLTDYFFENQLKVSIGAIESECRTSFGKTKAVVQYIMTWKPIDEKRGKIVIRIYSPNKIVPPNSYKGYGLVEGFSNELRAGEVIPPFISEISGEMEKTSLNDYIWVGTPKIDLVFPKIVPDFKIKPPSVINKYIISPIKEKLKELSGLINIFGGSSDLSEIIVLGKQDQNKINAEIGSIDRGEKMLDIYSSEDIKIKKENIKEEIDCSRTNLSSPLRKIIINEVAWMGDKKSSNNEWIELKNISKESINLKGWSLSDELKQINIVFEDIIIQSGDFLLLERNNDDNVPSKKADVIYTGSLSNTNEKLYLFDNNCKIEDFVFALPDWPAGNNIEKRTMERGVDLSWHSYFGNSVGNIFGTPRGKNSIEPKKKEVEKVTEVITKEPEKIISYCSQSELSIPSHKDIIINEVAWMGNKTSSSNEWIELKNISNKKINLIGWQLIDKGSQVKIIFDENDVILPGGFYLLERGSDENISNIDADKIYTGGLSNTNESLRLFNGDCILIDEALASPDWPAGNNLEKRTMERGVDLSWYSYFGDSLNNIFGTPRAKNSIEIKKKEVEKVTEVINKEPEKIISYCLQSGLSAPSHKDIIINEVAWMGNNESSNNEWIELKNISSKKINLSGWQLLDMGNQIKIVFDENDVILPGGFYLLERGSDDTVLNIYADKIYTGILSNTNESLRLFDSNCKLIDEVLALPNWPAGDINQRKTLERGNDLSWHSHSGLVTSGSPKSDNSQIIIFSGGGGSSFVPPPEEEKYCSIGLSLPAHDGIIINEVAWMGNNESSNNEWIELKNISEEEVSLSEWQLLSSENKIKVIFNEDDLILPGEFYLLERTNDETVLNIYADKIYTGALSNTNESLRLFDSNCKLIDEVLALPNWPAGDNIEKRTMERSADSSWYTYLLEGSDSLSEEFGTPKKENSIKINELEEDEEYSEEDSEEELEEDEEELEDEIQEEVEVQIVISEIQFNGPNNLEYIEIFNQGEKEVNLCEDEDHCYYISYFPSTFDEEGVLKYNWNNPYYNWRFSQDEIIQPMSHYLIIVYGDIDSDMLILNKEGESYSSSILNNHNGSVALFSDNPIYTGEEDLSEDEKIERAHLLKIDAVNWTKDNDIEGIIVKETLSTNFLANSERSIGRKRIVEKYKDSENNFEDFELQIPTPGEYSKQCPEGISEMNFSLIENHNNWIEMSWQAPNDPDSLPEEIDYEVYYSLNNEDLKLLSDYVDFQIEKDELENILIAKNFYYDKEYRFAIKAVDIDGNKSEISEEFIFSTLESNHLKDFIFGNPEKNNNFDFTGLDGEWGNESLEIILESFKNVASQFLVSDEGIIYISFGGEIMALEEDNILWKYECPSYCDIFSLNKDGTVYFADPYGINALSPSGKLKWKEPFNEVISSSISKDSFDKIYFVAKNNDNYSLYALEDNYSNAVFNNIYNIGDVYGGSNLVIDKNNNVYFSKNNILVKINYYSSLSEEKTIEVEYSEDYLGEKDKKTYISKIILSEDGRALVSSQNQFCDNNFCHRALNLISEDIKDIIWTKQDYGEPLAVGNEEFYLWQNTSPWDSCWYKFNLYGVSLDSGEFTWTKEWASDISISHIDYLVTNKEGRVYFIQGNNFKGYDLHNITSIKPEDDIIAMLNLPERPYKFAVINSHILFSFQNKIMSLKY
jgi:hypothetical protein